jgi:alanyl-tRNA synthetase
VEEIVNAEIRADAPVTVEETSYDEALRRGVIALFGEKYGERVRVVTVEGFTAELCGGTHLRSTGQIGMFLITAESSVGSGLRRIEAVTGRGAERYIRERLVALEGVAEVLSARQGEELSRAQAVAQELREQRHTIEQLRAQAATSSADALLSSARAVNGVQVLTAEVGAPDVGALRDMADRLRDRLGSAVVALGAIIEEKPLLVVTVSQDLLARGLHAGKLAGDAARQMGGGGGGRPHMAQAGGREADRLGQALGAVADMVAERTV